ncbi:MAG TPA: zinc ribbon domain-containing protein [Pyrinomonadaceae bacterium]|nr:zinc ribbon domain-containing protein [Pyrinomonadaceae bacterium]
MYCPKCGTKNAEDASFCRGCGANVRLVPQALEGRLPDAVVEGKPHRRSKKHRDDPPNLTYALVKTLVGIAFIIVALSVQDVYQIAGQIWWFWLLIPAAGSLGAGIAEFVRLYQHQPPKQLPAGNAYVPPAVSVAPQRAAELPPQRTSPDIYTPSSVTENTTKLLEKDR